MSLPLLCIAGATGSGKSDLCISLAKQISGEVLCIDAVQVYRGADIGSAKVTAVECDGIRHHCLDLIEPNEYIDAVQFGTICRQVVADIIGRGKIPILCVGSTMYFQSVIFDLIKASPRDEKLRRELEQFDSAELHTQLQKADSLRAEKLHPNDRVRIIRALEVHQNSPETMTTLHEDHSFSTRLYRTVVFCLVRPRAELYRRIDSRAAKMIDAGLISETESMRRSYGDSAPLFRAIGYSQAKDYLDQPSSISELQQSVAQATRNYAKRQLTFWKNEPQKRGMTVLPEQPLKGKGLTDPVAKDLSVVEIAQIYTDEGRKSDLEPSSVYFIGPTTE